ncbi:MAG: hypothetical protein ACI9MC_002635 [Kiritimatiellia bacterium]|jgi:hypothetical protein
MPVGIRGSGIGFDALKSLRRQTGNRAGFNPGLGELGLAYLRSDPEIDDDWLVVLLSNHQTSTAEGMSILTGTAPAHRATFGRGSV